MDAPQDETESCAPESAEARVGRTVPMMKGHPGQQWMQQAEDNEVEFKLFEGLSWQQRSVLEPAKATPLKVITLQK